MATTAETDDIRPGRLALSVGLPDLPSPEGWKWVKLREIAEMATGHTPSRSNSDYWGGDIPWIKAKDARPVDGGIINDSNEYTNERGISNSSAVVLPKGTVCLSRTGSIGYSVILGRPMATSQGFVNWVCSDAIVPRFLQALFILERPFLEDIAEGSAHETVYLSEAKAFHVCLPPIEEQRRIADRLDTIQSRTQATGETLALVPDRIEEYRQSVLNAAFTGQLTADWREDHPDVEPADELLERILEERREQWEKDYRAKYEAKGKEPPSGWESRYSPPDELERDDLPSQPESWEWVSLDQLLSNLRNGYSKAPKAEEGLPVLRISSVRPMSVDLDDVRYLADKPEDYRKYLIKPGYLLFIRYNGNENLVGVCGMVPELDQEYLHPDKLIRGEVAAPELTDPAFLEIALNTGEPRQHIRRRVRSTSGQSGISQDVLYSAPVPLPPIKEQREIVRRARQRLDKIDEMAQHVEQAGGRLEHLNRSVLAKAFRGELVETEAERARRKDRDYETAEELLERVRGESSSEDQTSSAAEEQVSTTTQVDENGQFEMRVVEDDPDL